MAHLKDLSTALLAAGCGDTVKLFDVSVEHGDPCILNYMPSPGCLIHSVKWNHTNLVVASAGEDKKISLWRTNGESMGTIPSAGTDSGDSIEESILAISFSTKGSRYICSGGSSQVVRIWDLQRKRCIKRLKGHNNTITGVMYNCRDEHLASISLSGDLILHNLSSGAKAAELKDPNQQVLRVLDYSTSSRHILVTAGDDGTVHLWDTTGRSPKVSWLNQHSAPTAGISFSSDDKIIASVGLDKKLYTFDPGSRRHSSCITYEAPFSSLAFIDDDWLLTAGTSDGRVVFYDIRGKPQPLTVLRACSSSEAVSSLCWQRAKPVFVDETSCKAETALLGGAVGDSILMPDPLPSMTSNVSLPTAVSSSRPSGRSGPSVNASSLPRRGTGYALRTQSLPSAEESPQRSYLRPGGPLSRLHASRSNYNFKDDMDVFSPLVDVQPITPSLDKLWDAQEGAKKDHVLIDKKPSSMFPLSSKRFLYVADGANDHPIFDWKPSSISKQDDTGSFATLGSTPSTSSKSEDSSITPPEAWGGEKISDKYAFLCQPVNLPSLSGMSSSNGLTSSSLFSGFQDMPSSLNQTSTSSLADSNMSRENLCAKGSYQENSPLRFPEHLSSLCSLSLGTTSLGSGNLDSPRTSSLFSTHRVTGRSYVERTSGTPLSVGSPKTKKTGAETKEELLSNFLSRSDTSAATVPQFPPAITCGMSQSLKSPQPDPSEGNNFTLQLFQRTVEETLDSFQKSIHEDMRNLHIEILRQFHLQETQMSEVMSSILENQAGLIKEIKSLNKWWGCSS